VSGLGEESFIVQLFSQTSSPQLGIWEIYFLYQLWGIISCRAPGEKKFPKTPKENHYLWRTCGNLFPIVPGGNNFLMEKITFVADNQLF